MRSKVGLDRNALFCDETKDYRIPAEPEAGEKVKIRFRTARDNADAVYLVVDRYEIRMKIVKSDQVFDYYEAELCMDDEQLFYHFEIDCGDEFCYYNKLGCVSNLQEQYPFKITSGFHTPKWAKGAVFYQIYVDRFYNGNPDNDVLSGEYSYVGGQSVRITDWEKYPDALDVRCFYGGDLQGVRAKLDYLEELGVEVIYFNPLFVSPSNHKYDIQDYDYIDPHFGILKNDEGNLLKIGMKDNSKATRYISRVTAKENLEASNAYFAELVAEIHKRGMKVILDGVFNHCGSFNKWLDRERIYEEQDGYEKGAYVSEESPYHKFFQFFEGKWPYNYHYDGWWGHDTLPKLNYEGSRELYDYMMHIGKKWVSPPYSVDGWRLDVAADLGHSNEFNHQFWHDFRAAVKESNPEAIILAEHYGDPSGWMQGDQWDTVMNYDAFMEPLTWFLTGMEKHSDEYNENLYGNGGWFFHTMKYNMSKFQRPSLDIAMNELSNHDHSRFLTRTNRRVGRTAQQGPEAANEGIEKGVLREGVVIQMTWPGAPTLYYGDEAGMTGWTDPDNRRGFPWGKEDWELIEFHKYMIQIHKKYECLRTGSVKEILSDRHILVYGRFCEEDQAIIIVNNRREDCHLQIPVWQANVGLFDKLVRVMQTSSVGYNVGRIEMRAEQGMLDITVGPQSATVLVSEEDEPFHLIHRKD